MLSKLFEFYVTTEFRYAPYIFACIIVLFVATYIYDFYVKSIEDKNKMLFKAMKGKVGYYRWAFTTSALIMVIARLESIPLLNMRFFWIIYGILFLVYSYFFIKGIIDNYKGRMKNKERFRS